MWIDSHCHLDAGEFEPDRDAVVARARGVGVAQIVLPAVARDNFVAVRQLAHRHDLVYALGIHPLCVDRAADDDLAQLRSALVAHRGDPRLVAIGEIGIDHFVAGLDRDRQARFYAAQLKLAREFDLPVIVHVRRSADTLLKHLRATPVRGGIAHAFNGSAQQAAAFVDLGFRLGFGGAMTFDRALRIRELARSLPAHAIVLETDSPDIPPHWLYKTAAERGVGHNASATDTTATATAQARNEPAQLPRIAETMAELRGLPLAALAELTSANVRAALPGVM